MPRRAPAPAAPLRQPSRSATLPPRRPAPPPSRRSPITPAGQSSGGGARAMLIGIPLAVIAVVAVALLATGVLGGGDDPAPPPNTTPGPAAGSASPASLTPASTKVAVLNGTTILGLASTERDKLADAGYTEVTTGNNSNQQRADSAVLYGSRTGARAQARTVARRLDISQIERLDSATRDLSENADVVVILGQDKAP
jgi:hypothetical protein